jgi:hypothetical protein
MSVTHGMRTILGADKIRLFSDTGAWKQTALRVALFSPENARLPDDAAAVASRRRRDSDGRDR